MVYILYSLLDPFYVPQLLVGHAYCHVKLIGHSVFLAVAAYLIFGSWLNYNRYSARGWDLVPHSETLRDIPYIFKDWMRRVVNTLQGGGSRGGYSAV